MARCDWCTVTSWPPTRLDWMGCDLLMRPIVPPFLPLCGGCARGKRGRPTNVAFTDRTTGAVRDYLRPLLRIRREVAPASSPRLVSATNSRRTVREGGMTTRPSRLPPALPDRRAVASASLPKGHVGIPGGPTISTPYSAATAVRRAASGGSLGGGGRVSACAGSPTV